MKELLLSLLKSKKFVMAVLGVVAFLLGKLGLNLASEQLYLFVSPFLAYILGQGIADHGKSAELVRSADRAELQRSADRAALVAKEAPPEA